MTSFNLEQSARELIEAIAKGPPLSGVSLAEARKAVEAAQSAPISMPDVDESWAGLASPSGSLAHELIFLGRGPRSVTRRWTALW